MATLALTLSGVDSATLAHCLRDVVTEMGTDEQTALAVLESRYPGITQRWTEYTAVLFQRIPNEVVVQIMSSISPRAILRLGQAGARYNQASRDPELWKRLLKRDWGERYFSSDPYAQYKQYQQLYIPYTEIPGMVEDMRRILLNTLPDTQAMSKFRKLIADRRSCLIRTVEGEHRVDIDDIPRTGPVLSVAFDPGFRYGRRRDLYRDVDAPWCGEETRLDWAVHGRAEILKQLLLLYPASQWVVDANVVQDTSSNRFIVGMFISKGAKTIGVIPLEIQPEVDQTAITLPLLNTVCKNIQAAILACLNEGQDGKEMARLVNTNNTFLLFGRVEETPEEQTVYAGVYNSRQIEPPQLAPNDFITGVSYNIPYYTNVARNLGAQCQQRQGYVFAGLDSMFDKNKLKTESADTIPALIVHFLRQISRGRRYLRATQTMPGWSLHATVSQDSDTLYHTLSVWIQRIPPLSASEWAWERYN